MIVVLVVLACRDGGSGWASRAMALLCFRLVGPEYALALLLLGHKNCGKSCVCSRSLQ